MNMDLNHAIPKLQGRGNYNLWAFLLSVYLRKKNLWRVVEVGALTEEEQRKDGEAMFIITSFIEIECLAELVGKEKPLNDCFITAKLMWDRLQHFYKT